MALTNTTLAIVKGVMKTPAIADETEDGLTLIDLYDIKGFSTESYEVVLPSIKSSSIYADSPLSNGRRLIASGKANIVETIRIEMHAASLKTVANLIVQLNRIAQDCRNFWQTRHQIQPVYLKHQLPGEPGPRYALLHNIEVSLVEPLEPLTPQRTVTLSIEREADWRGQVAPGDNPDKWMRYVQNQPFNTNNGTIYGTNANFPPFFTESLVDNKSEWTTSAFGALTTNNAIKIPASRIPGDAEALTCMVISQSGSRLNLYLGKKTVNPTVFSNLSPSQIITPPNGTFNGPDGTLGTSASLASDTGGVRAAGSGTAQRVEISFASAANALRLNFPVADTGKINRFIGSWMAFMRCRQVGGTSGQITMYLRYGFDIAGDSDGIALTPVIPQIQGTSGNTTDWGLSYMGVITIPFVGDAKASVGTADFTAEHGLSGSQTNFDIGLMAARSAGVGVLYISDLILIPFDEAAFNIRPSDSVVGTRVLVDNTGYFTRGLRDVYHAQPGTPDALTRFTGNEITLTPGVDNYIYIIGADNSMLSRTSDQFTFVVHTVPRWGYLRDV